MLRRLCGASHIGHFSDIVLKQPHIVLAYAAVVLMREGGVACSDFRLLFAHLGQHLRVLGQKGGVIDPALLCLTLVSAKLLIATAILDVRMAGAHHLLFLKLAELLVHRLLVFAGDCDQVQKLLVLLMLSNLFLNL